MASKSPNIVILPGLCGLTELCTRCEMMVYPNHKKLCEKFYNLVVKNSRGETKCYFCDMKFKFRNKAYHHIKLKHFSKKVVISCKKLSNETIDEYKKKPIENIHRQSPLLLTPQIENNNVLNQKQVIIKKKVVRKKLFASPKGGALPFSPDPDLKMKKQEIGKTSNIPLNFEKDSSYLLDQLSTNELAEMMVKLSPTNLKMKKEVPSPVPSE